MFGSLCMVNRQIASAGRSCSASGWIISQFTIDECLAFWQTDCAPHPVLNLLSAELDPWICVLIPEPVVVGRGAT
jgi:hypothetical protein